MLCYTEPVVFELWCVMPNHWLWLIWDSGCELWCVMLDQWLWIMVCYAVPVVVNHDVLCWVSGCELCCTILVNHGELYWASGCESWYAMLWQWLWVMVSFDVPRMWIMVCYAEPVVENYAVLCWFEWLWVMVCNAEPVVVNRGVLCWTSGCESWWVMLHQL
jgi:hypothetical protein